MKDILCILLFSLVAMSIALADTIIMKSGMKIEGEIQTITADSVTIKTTSGIVTIAAVDIATIETAKTEPPPRDINDAAIPKSIKMVGYGCLGGVVGGSVAGLVGVWTEGYGDPYVAGTVIFGAIIAGVLMGVAIGSK